MSIFRAMVRRDLAVYRAGLVDLALLLLIAIAAFPGDSPAGFAVMGTIAAASLGTWLGGDENLTGSLEFLLTRPVERRDWFRMRFFAGLAALGLVLTIVGLADAVEFHQGFVSLLAEPLWLNDAAANRAFDYAAPVGFVAMVYALAFFLAVSERRPAHVRDARVTSVMLGLLLACGAALVLALLAGLENGFRNLLGVEEQRLWFAACFAAAALFTAGLACRRFVRAEVSDSRGAAAASSTNWSLVVVLLIGVLALAAYFVVLPSAPR